MRRPAVLVVAAAFGAALLVTLWLVREMRLAASTSGTVARPATEAAVAAQAGAAPIATGHATATAGASSLTAASSALGR